ncbi:MAG: hypothetical protein AB1705_09240 [Verrucomicrobiota bacterium]
MNKMPLMVLVILAAAFWVSAIGLLVLALTQKNLGAIKWVALADGLVALVFTFLASRKWTTGR